MQKAREYAGITTAFFRYDAQSNGLLFVKFEYEHTDVVGAHA